MTVFMTNMKSESASEVVGPVTCPLLALLLVEIDAVTFAGRRRNFNTGLTPAA